MNANNLESSGRPQLNRAPRRMLRCVSSRSARRVAILCLLLAGCSAPPSVSLPYPFESHEADAVRELLARDTSWHLAVDADSENATAIAALRELDATFTPYFTRDTSRAGGAGLAFVLTRENEFKVFYMRGDSAEALVLDEVAAMSWLADGFVRLRGDSLDIALFNSGEIISFVWDSSTRNMALLPEGPPADAPDSTLANRPPTA